MTNPVTAAVGGSAPVISDIHSGKGSQAEDIGRRFEQMLWAEMLSHSGLEKALTQSGGQDASAFSRYLIEAIAEDISEKHPLGLGDAASAPARHSALGGD